MPNSPSVALLGRDDAVRAQLRSALSELGARLVFEGDIVGADAAEVASTSPEVVLLNLDADGEDALDSLDALLLDPSMKVVFNEAETTASLSGWDLARWARHLAAKVLGHDKTIPPAPEGSEYTPENGFLPSPGAPPTPESESAPMSIEALQGEASVSLSGVPSSDSLVTESSADAEREPAADSDTGSDAGDDVSEADLGAIDFSEIESALEREAESTESESESEAENDGEDQRPAGADVEADEGQSGYDVEFSDVEAALAQIDAENPGSRATGDRDAGEESAGALSVDGGESSDKDRGADDTTAVELESMIELDTATLGDLTPVELEDSHELSLDDNEVAPPVRMGFSDDAEDESSDTEIDEAVAALAAQLDALDDAPRGEMDVRDPDFSFDLSEKDEPHSSSDVDARSTAGGGNSAAADHADAESGSTDPKADALDISELDLEDDLTEAQHAGSRITTEAPAINISHLSLEDLPDPGLVVESAPKKQKVDEPYVPRPGIDLELAPLGSFSEDAAKSGGSSDRPEAHRAMAKDVGEDFDLSDDSLSDDSPSNESLSIESLSNDDLSSDQPSSEGLDLDLELAPLEDEDLPASPTGQTQGIRRVLVLGASIGGPDALRTFLGGLPVDFPALVVLAQHLESGFFDRLAQQLQKVCKLPVRVSKAGQAASESEVVVIPSGERVLIDPSGSVSHEALSQPTHYRPCIDDVMRDIADRFGARATAIIFSGMAGDAVEGAVYLTGKGGEVWAQKPDSCVVSSMVDGAQARGVVEFIGTPRELADHCIGRYGSGK